MMIMRRIIYLLFKSDGPNSSHLHLPYFPDYRAHLNISLAYIYM